MSLPELELVDKSLPRNPNIVELRIACNNCNGYRFENGCRRLMHSNESTVGADASVDV